MTSSLLRVLNGPVLESRKRNVGIKFTHLAVVYLAEPSLHMPFTSTVSIKSLLAFASIVDLVFGPRRDTRWHSHSWFRAPSNPMTVFFFLSRLLRTLKWVFLFDERKGPTASGHPPFAGVWLCRLSLSPCLRRFLCFPCRSYIARTIGKIYSVMLRKSCVGVRSWSRIVRRRYQATTIEDIDDWVLVVMICGICRLVKLL